MTPLEKIIVVVCYVMLIVAVIMSNVSFSDKLIILSVFTILYTVLIGLYSKARSMGKKR